MIRELLVVSSISNHFTPSFPRLTLRPLVLPTLLSQLPQRTSEPPFKVCNNGSSRALRGKGVKCSINPSSVIQSHHIESQHTDTYPSGISVAAYNLGCFSGAISTIWLGNYLGRRRAIFLGSSIMIVGAILQCSSFSLAQFIVGRLVTGFGMLPLELPLSYAK